MQNGSLVSDIDSNSIIMYYSTKFQITMSRGIPFTMLTLGSLYFARTRLPAKYHFGPKVRNPLINCTKSVDLASKATRLFCMNIMWNWQSSQGWPFYFIMGIGSFTAANVMSMGTCRDRVQPKIAQLWQKVFRSHLSSVPSLLNYFWILDSLSNIMTLIIKW